MLFAAIIFSLQVMQQDMEEAAGQDAARTDRVLQSEINSPLPLFSDFDTDPIWPRSMPSTGPLPWQCESPMRYGYWRLVGDPWYGDATMQLSSAHLGIYACHTQFKKVDGNVVGTFGQDILLVALGTTTDRAGEHDLWALQYGFGAGPRYQLLRSKPFEGSEIETFELLQSVCPEDSRVPSRLADHEFYHCMIETQDDLAAMARDMAELPAIGSMSWIPEPPRAESKEPDTGPGSF